LILKYKSRKDYIIRQHEHLVKSFISIVEQNHLSLTFLLIKGPNDIKASKLDLKVKKQKPEAA
jgi:hypothetical protein